jgi:gas vesicle protein
MRENIGVFLVGLGAGAAIGLLLAPKAGHEVRGLIAGTAKDSVDAVKAGAAGLVDAANRTLEDSRSELLRQGEGVKAAFEAGTKAYRKATS